MPADSHLHSRPKSITHPAPTGLQALPDANGRDSYLYVPPGYRPERPAPMALLLHGAGGHALHGLDLLRDHADAAGLILLAPASHDSTWDLIARHYYGADVDLIERSLAMVFADYAIDTGRLAVGGFSDGASYALSLGMDNGNLFSHVIAFSPGFILPLASRGLPRVFISHGDADDVLPVAICSRRIVPRLEREGYPVEYIEFPGGHVVPPDIARRSVCWFLEQDNAGMPRQFATE
jgi:phospholipase/carboxylesterase